MIMLYLTAELPTIINEFKVSMSYAMVFCVLLSFNLRLGMGCLVSECFIFMTNQYVGHAPPFEPVPSCYPIYSLHIFTPLTTLIQ